MSEIDFHTIDCQAQIKQWKDEFNFYLSLWPNACRTCHATGVFFNTQDEEDGCDDCIYAEKCPRCGGAFEYKHSESRCPHCGWQMLEQEHLPFPPECDCLDAVFYALSGAHQ